MLATALPTIVADLNGAENYSWVGTSYLLASAAFTPLYGRARLAPSKCLFTVAICLVGNLSFTDQY
jgi:MFS family permease